MSDETPTHYVVLNNHGLPIAVREKVEDAAEYMATRARWLAEYPNNVADCAMTLVPVHEPAKGF